jgi:hypothetical protein
MTIPRPRLRWIVVATILFVAFAGCTVGWIVETDLAVRIDYYRLVDEHTLVVGAETEDRSWTRVTSVVETTTTVTITVRELQAPIRMGGTGVGGGGIELIVKLRDPIGSRTVVDGSSGEVVALTRCLPPETMRPECL